MRPIVKSTDNLTARLGASSSKGGTSPGIPFGYAFSSNRQCFFFTSIKSSNPDYFGQPSISFGFKLTQTYPSSLIMFRSVPTRPFFDFPVSSCIRVLTWECCLTSSNGRKNRLNVRHLYKIWSFNGSTSVNLLLKTYQEDKMSKSLICPR